MTLHRRRAGWRSERGFTLVESLTAAFVSVVGLLATAALIDVATGSMSTTRQRDGATNLARELVESARQIPYDGLSSTTVETALQRQPGLEDTAGAGYVIRRNNVSYGIEVDVCVMDDPSDGGGQRPATATFCADSAPPGITDKNPEDYKRITVRTSWQRNVASRAVMQSGILNNPGSSSGPAIRSLTPQVGSAPYVVTNPLTTSIDVDLTTSSVPTTLNWLLDGTVKQPPPVQNGPSGQAWRFTWPIGDVATGVLDGDYMVSAEAFNQYGVSGPGRQETIILNRRQPFSPQELAGGRTSFGTVEIEWTANSERDIVGYEVMRAGSSTPVCALADQKLDTFCTDASPPDADPLVYYVYAYDKDPVSGAPRQGDQSLPLTAVKANTPPNPPSGLTLQRQADGLVTLTWSRPSPEDADPGDGVDFYRVYRDGQLLGDRYARWFDADAQITWQDTQTGGETHSYWVTAVDKHFTESTQIGPVTG